ncbi:MAG: hypothetical protein ABSB30_00170 [Terracidiphilus sp.]|jgi:hypothetical protein
MAAVALEYSPTQPMYRPSKALTDNQFESRRETSVASSAAFTKPRELAFVIPSEGRAQRILVTLTTDQLPTWVKPTISAIMGVQTLPENWDSYGAKKIKSDLFSQSLSFLGLIMDTTSPAPSVVPLGDGGLQLEWHRKQQDLEIAFPADDTPQFFYQNKTTGVEQEGSASDVANLAQLLRNIA